MPGVEALEVVQSQEEDRTLLDRPGRRGILPAIEQRKLRDALHGTLGMENLFPPRRGRPVDLHAPVQEDVETAAPLPFSKEDRAPRNPPPDCALCHRLKRFHLQSVKEGHPLQGVDSVGLHLRHLKIGSWIAGRRLPPTQNREIGSACQRLGRSQPWTSEMNVAVPALWGPSSRYTSGGKEPVE